MNSTRKKIIILIVAVGLISGSIVYWIILPTMRDIKQITAAVYAERLDLEKKYLRGQLLKKTVADFEQVKDQQAVLTKSFVAAGQELKFIQTLENLASQHQIDQEIKLAADATSQKSADLSPLPLTLNLKATFNQTMDYLQDLERLNLYIVISSFNIAIVGESQQRPQGLTNTVLTGKVYRLGEGQVE